MAEAKSRAEEAKGQAQAALDRATATKNKVERSNNELRDLIKQIREFLTRESPGAEVPLTPSHHHLHHRACRQRFPSHPNIIMYRYIIEPVDRGSPHIMQASWSP